MLPLLSIVLLGVIPGLVQGIQFAIYNNCRTSLDIYINGEKAATLTGREPLIREFEDGWSGYIYSDANGGSQDGSIGTLRAGFFGDGRYFMVRDPAWINSPLSINYFHHEDSESSGVRILVG
ncbi:hypothetical protein FA15DRAFT_524208 [Coprinopsis marcescibilis]|uniref:Uncharacterized protein n=1 Tax=Coprinopsis marcescibilis TaxID=230819 RepID=A0A5C3KP53_COPMA|nr:hypothetical protein FA15DRAFT_524208 [Coprinopsis marcescibilis]